MIAGKINHGLEAVIIVDFVGSDGLLHSLEAVLDTGYNGDLTLPQGTIQQLGLVLLGQRSATLASGESVVLNAYLGTVSWHGLPRQVVILQTDEEPLLGMSLLQDSRVILEVWDDGGVLIEDRQRSGRSSP